MKRAKGAEILLSCGNQNAPHNQRLTKLTLRIPGQNTVSLPYVIALKTRGPRGPNRSTVMPTRFA
jgi:hypothetical protein